MTLSTSIDELELGKTPEPFTLDEREDHRVVTARLVRQTRRTLEICSRSLDPVIFEDDEFLSGVKDVATSGRFARVRIVVLDSEPVFRRGHRLVELAQRLSSYISVRIPGPTHRSFNQAFVIGDERGYVHQKLSDRFEAVADFADMPYAEELLREFDKMWESSDIDPNFNRLAL